MNDFHLALLIFLEDEALSSDDEERVNLKQSALFKKRIAEGAS